MPLLLTQSNLTKLYVINLMLERYYVWVVLNLWMLITAPFNGFESISPKNVAGANPDIIFCSVSFLGLLLFSPAAVAYAISRHPDLKLIPPSLKRFPLNWWIDPIQSLYMSAFTITLVSLGAIWGYQRFGGNFGYWTMMWDLSLMLGVWGGIALVYVFYRKRFASSSRCNPLGGTDPSTGSG